jgi:hypothetical protein
VQRDLHDLLEVGLPCLFSAWIDRPKCFGDDRIVTRNEVGNPVKRCGEANEPEHCSDLVDVQTIKVINDDYDSLARLTQ